MLRTLLGLLLPLGAVSLQGAERELALDSEVYANSRALRVLLPPSYDEPAARERRYRVFCFLDGVAAWDAWGVPAVVRELWRADAIPELIFVGVDNGGCTSETTDPVRDRASEYLPYPDPTWTGPLAPEPGAHSSPSSCSTRSCP